MSETRTIPATARPEKRADFNDSVDRCLAIVMHYSEVQEIATVVKKVHAEMLLEKTKCDQEQ